MNHTMQQYLRALYMTNLLSGYVFYRGHNFITTHQNTHLPYLSISSMKNHLPRYLPTYRAVPRSRHVAPCWLVRMKFWLTCSLRHEYIIIYFYYYFPLYFLFVSFNLGSQLPTNQESWLSITHILRHLCIFLFINIKYYFPFIVMLFLHQYGIKKIQ